MARLLKILTSLSIISCYVSPLSYAQTASQQPLYHSAKQIQTQVKHYLQSHYQQQSHIEKIDISVNSLDPRLKLRRCEGKLQINHSNQTQLSQRSTVKVACKNGPSWAIFVSARILAYAKILVAAEPLVRGQILSSQNIALEVKPYKPNARGFHQAKRLIGMQLKRPIPQGAIISSHAVTAPKVIKRGDEVILAARLGSAEISTEATALADGKIGQQIRVKNNRSQRIINARVIAAGKVAVTL